VVSPAKKNEEPLARYRSKRDFTTTPEPAGDGSRKPGEAPLPRFVVQQHHATRLHWDLRLEHDGALASWAIPNGIPADPAENRLAVRTEDHPLEYLDFEGEIPKGQYGAGTMKIWDDGTFEVHKWEERKVEVTFHGERLRGRYGLFPIGRDGDSKNDWMIHRMDPPADPGRESMPEHVVPMLARIGKLPGDQERWSFEVKWDGVRAIAYAQPGRLRLESRNLNEITSTYPEVRAILDDLGMHEAVLDGEIVAFDYSDPTHPKPSFERLQRRMHVTAPAAVRRLAASVPVVYAIFDLLYLDGHLLMELPYTERRARLEQLELGGRAWRVPAAHPGEGELLLEATASQGLEGVVAKRLDSHYEPGRRSSAWVKVKHTRRQELVIGGWIPGEGRRAERIGALLMGYYQPDDAGAAQSGSRTTRAPADPARLDAERPASASGRRAGSRPAGAFVYAGRVGTGFTERSLSELEAKLNRYRRDTSPFATGPKLPRDAVFVEPCLVAEIEFREWTAEGVMRAPSFKGLREDKSPREVVLEVEAEPVSSSGSGAPGASSTGSAAPGAGSSGSRAPGASSAGRAPKAPKAGAQPDSPEALFDEVERLPDGALAVLTDGRRLKLTNWDKVLFPKAGFTKGELIAYYARIAPVVLPHLRDRPLTLKRYPNGVESDYFYEKQSPSHRPEWVQTARIGSIDYTLAQDRPTLIWLANLADVELHTSLSLAHSPQQPTMLVFDLDPGPPAGIAECCEVGQVLHGLFAQLGAESFAKTSGSKGLQVYVPLNVAVSYEQTKPLARRIAELLEQRMPELVVSRMTKRLRPGRVLVDWSQNDAHKTTVTVYSGRARERPTVSTPVTWEEVARCREAGGERMLTFEVDEVLARAGEQGDLFAPVLSLKQELPAVG
jgi:bifunctional non-homologous end joining protein LigD